MVENSDRAVRGPWNFENGALGKIRTPDPQIRSLVLYPAELRAREIGLREFLTIWQAPIDEKLIFVFHRPMTATPMMREVTRLLVFGKVPPFNFGINRAR